MFELLPELDELEGELEDPEPDVPGHFPLGIEPLVLDGFVAVVPEELVPLVPVPELEEPDVVELVVVELGVVEFDVAANATDVPTPASTPVRSRPAANCFVRSLMVNTSLFCRPAEGPGHRGIAIRGVAVKSIKRR